ncbi:hypothetical protein L5515_014211 [Caenorhabditis briggsae]|uniref:Uncharacterized protein n=1 Tax=Caenorhabditis briggsae TaxID=6238 RepID=A0AAE9ECQ2_CAEBR|nr:hypothetical protein L3Y34_018091 [Caenorhabditis briggsae]UMM17866.1 hypothetical protein L5515_014211 [Caenorhabditis briggsae]
MRSLVLFFLLIVTISTVFGQYDESADSGDSVISLEDPSSSSSEEIIGEGVIVEEEGSGSGDGPIEQIHIFGILPGPGDIRKKRSIMDVLSRK